MEEFHRGKWIPLLQKNDKQRTVRISEHTAEVMNRDSKALGERYVLADSKKDVDASKGAGSEKPNKDWTNAEIKQWLIDAEVEIPKEATKKDDLLALVK